MMICLRLTHHYHYFIHSLINNPDTGVMKCPWRPWFVISIRIRFRYNLIQNSERDIQILLRQKDISVKLVIFTWKRVLLMLYFCSLSLYLYRIMYSVAGRYAQLWLILMIGVQMAGPLMISSTNGRRMNLFRSLMISTCRALLWRSMSATTATLRPTQVS